MSLDPAIQTLVDASVTSLNAGLEGALDGFNVSLGTIAALFGEEFQQDFLAQLNQFDLELDFDIEAIKFKALELKLNLDVQLKNIELEFQDLQLNLGVKAIEAIEPPQLGFIKWINSVGKYIIMAACVVAVFILYDAYNIKKLSEQVGIEQRNSIENYF